MSDVGVSYGQLRRRAMGGNGVSGPPATGGPASTQYGNCGSAIQWYRFSVNYQNDVAWKSSGDFTPSILQAAVSMRTANSQLADTR